MSELKGEKVCRLHRVGISQVHEVSIESSSSRTAGIRYPQNWRNGKKNLRRFVLKIQKEKPESDVEVWSMDEQRIGLKPVLRPEWVDEFSDATALVNWRFQWLWLYRESISEYRRNQKSGYCHLSTPSFSSEVSEDFALL
jgi:hypothetical protein